MHHFHIIFKEMGGRQEQATLYLILTKQHWDIDTIYEKFNFPENPLSNAEPPKHRREHIDNMQLLSPPRRVRRCGIKQLTDSLQHSSCPIHDIPNEDTVCIHLSMIRKNCCCLLKIVAYKYIYFFKETACSHLTSVKQYVDSRRPIDTTSQEQIDQRRPIRSRRCKAVCPPVDNSTTMDGPSCSQEQITSINQTQRPQRTRRRPQFLNDYECN